MHNLFVYIVLAGVSVCAACNRDDPAKAPDAVPPGGQTVEQHASPRPPPIAEPRAPVQPFPAEPLTPPAPIVDGMHVIYACDNGTEPKITFAGNLVKVELTAESTPVILSARASATNMSDTYSDEALTLHRDGMGITLDLGGGKATRCTEKEASA